MSGLVSTFLDWTCLKSARRLCSLRKGGSVPPSRGRMCSSLSRFPLPLPASPARSSGLRSQTGLPLLSYPQFFPSCMTTAEAQARYPLTQGVNPWLVTVSVMLPTFMEVLDTAIASVALPYIAGSLSSTNSEATWVLTSYLVANAVILPASNWFARRFGRKRFLLTCVIIFTVASFFCGAAPSLGIILLARVLQGAGGGALQPLSQSILLESFPPAKRSMAMAAYGLGIVVAPVLGPTLGGWLTDTFSWRYAFYINIPVGMLAVDPDRPLCPRPAVHQERQSRRIRQHWLWPADCMDRLPADRSRQRSGRRLVRRRVGALGSGSADRRARRLDLAIVDQPQGPCRPARPQKPQLPHRLLPDRAAGDVHLHHHHHSAALLPGSAGLHGLHCRTGRGSARHRVVHRLAGRSAFSARGSTTASC